MAEVNIIGLNKRFGEVQALNDVSFDVKDQEFVTMLGPTGAGKTTTLRCVAGLEKLDRARSMSTVQISTVLPPRPAEHGICLAALCPLSAHDGLPQPAVPAG